MSAETKAALIHFGGSIASAIITLFGIIIIALLGATTFAEWENTREIERRIYDQRYAISQEFHENIMAAMDVGGQYFLYYVNRDDTQKFEKVDFEAAVQFVSIINRIQHNAAMSKILFQNKEISNQIFLIGAKLSSTEIAECKSLEQFFVLIKPIIRDTNKVLTLMAEEIY